MCPSTTRVGFSAVTTPASVDATDRPSITRVSAPRSSAVRRFFSKPVTRAASLGTGEDEDPATGTDHYDGGADALDGTVACETVITVP